MLLVLVLSFSYAVDAKFMVGSSRGTDFLVGDPCTDSTTGMSGICQELEDCGHLMRTVLAQQPYTRCGYVRSSEIVCCPPTPTPDSSPVRLAPRISEIKCSEYAKHVYATSELVVGGSKKTIVTDLCSHIVVSLILGGVNANEGEFPHMALLGFGFDNSNLIFWKCGGTLISDEYVLTAAHCIYYGELRRVRLGDHDHAQENRNREEFGVLQTIVHPSYHIGMDYFDIALVKLDRKTPFNAYIRPACLPREFDDSQPEAIATGWGASFFSGQDMPILQKVCLDIFAGRECAEAYTRADSLPGGVNFTQQVCAGSYTEIRDTCHGDSGGPLQIFRWSDYCMYTLIGVTSTGGLCGLEGVPGIYQKVYPHLNWIESIVWPNEN